MKRKRKLKLTNKSGELSRLKSLSSGKRGKKEMGKKRKVMADRLRRMRSGSIYARTKTKRANNQQILNTVNR